MKEMVGVSWGLSEWQATKATALRKTIALRIRRTEQVSETASIRITAAISEGFTCIRKQCHSH